MPGKPQTRFECSNNFVAMMSPPIRTAAPWPPTPSCACLELLERDSPEWQDPSPRASSRGVNDYASPLPTPISAVSS